jgi:Ca2+-binding RTX toxin-like protein
MVDQTGLVIAGDDEANTLSVKIVDETDGTRSIYNVIKAGGGNDRVFGRDEDGDTLPYGVQLFGEDGDDEIRDSVNADTLSGGSGNDVVYYAGGADFIDGGDGIDTVSFAETLPAGRISLDNLTLSNIEKLVIYDGLNVGHFDLNSLSTIEAHSWATETTLLFTQQATLTDVKLVGKKTEWRITGSGLDDQFEFSTSAISLSINGGLGNDIIFGGERGNVIDGNSGNDTLIGGDAPDAIAGGNGNDEISGAGGNDYYLFGESGDDNIFGGDGNDTIDGGEGDDKIFGGDGKDLIYASSGHDIINGGDGDDKVYLAAKVLIDTQILNGGSGNDTFLGSSFDTDVRVNIQGGKGVDKLELRNGDLSHITIKGVEILDLSWTSKITIGAETLDNIQRILGVNGSELDITLSSGGSVTWDKGMVNSYWTDMQGSSQADHIDVSSAAGAFWTIDGGKGDDVIIGPSSRKVSTDIKGGDGNDRLVAGSGGAFMVGGRGNDTFIEGAGGDGMDCSDGGTDTIIVSRNSGNNGVQGISFSGTGRDVIDLSAVRSIDDFEDLMKNHVREYQDAKGHLAGTMIDFGSKNTLFLDDVGISDFKEASFIF